MTDLSAAALGLASAIDGERLSTLLAELATIGGLPNGGVNRQALTREDTAAKNRVCDWARRAGLAVFQDEAANLYVRLEGSDAAAEPVLLGSHLDSQPTGGRYDGAYGVMAALEVLQAARDRGLRPRRSIEAVAWTNEEGSRFLPGATGSSAFAGTRQLADMVAGETVDGARIREELERSISETNAPHRPLAAVRPAAYLEAHIEQGPILEREGLTIGVVDGIQGVRRIRIDVAGETAHAGTMPHRLRKDALLAANRIIAALQPLTEEPEDVLRLTFGRLEVWPNSPNTVPGRARITLDLRHPDQAAIDEVTSRIERTCKSLAPPCTVEMTVVSSVAPVRFDGDVRALIARSSQALQIPSRAILSGAGHDALHLARVCPTGMVFVPCRDGVSHHESEDATPADLAAGTRVLAAATWHLAER